MKSTTEKSAGRFLGPNEWLFLLLVDLFWSIFVVVLGKDTSWDFRNYHWYIPYAFLNGRSGIDIAVAHQATFYNPVLDIPFYWLATHTHSWFALAVLGAVQGANIFPLYLLSREIINFDDRKLAAAALSLIGITGALTVSLFGTTYYDNVMSVLVLSAIAVVVTMRARLREGPLLTTALLSAFAGLLAGSALGLKLPELPFAVGFAAALIAVGGDIKHQAVRLSAGGIAGLAGFAAFAGYWMLHMQHLTGNPLFPYFNDYFKSPLALDAPYRDLRFIPTHFWRAVFFPVLFSFDWHVADDLGFQDMRVGLAYLLAITASVLWLLRRRSPQPLVNPDAAWILMAFAAASYFVWLRLFAIYRYILCLEMISPIIITIAIGLLPLARRMQMIVLAGLLFAILVTARSDFIEREPLGDPYVQVALPPIAHPDRTIIVMTGDGPLGFIAPSIPRQIPLLRIDGWMYQPRDGTMVTRQMRDRIAEHLRRGGDVDLIADAYDMTRAHDALADDGLAIRWTECRLFDTNLAGAYQFCPLAPRH